MNVMVMVVYNESIDLEVMEMLDKCGLCNYTKIKEAYGKGKTSGSHFGDDIWPGRNNILYVACSDKEAKVVLELVRNLRNSLGEEGIKAFSWDLNEIT